MVPFGGDYHGVGVLRDFVGGIADLQRGMGFAGFLHGFGIVGADAGAFGGEALDQRDGGGEANVVGIGFEGQAENADFFSAEDPEGAAEFFYEMIDAAIVDVFGFLENVMRRRRSGAARRMKACRSLGRQKPPKPMPARRKLSPMRGSLPTARTTSSISAPNFSARSASMLA